MNTNYSFKITNAKNGGICCVPAVPAIPDSELPKRNTVRQKVANTKRPKKTHAGITYQKWNIRLWIYFAILAHMVRGALWMWLYRVISFIIPHTFAWESLLNQFGSVCKLKNCISYKEDCLTELACPIVPILFTSLSAIQILIIICILVKICPNPCFLSLKYIAVFDVIAFVFLTPIASTLFILNVVKLNATMITQLNNFATNVTKVQQNRWNITQYTKKCCGIKTYTDWDSSIDFYPESCCDSNVGFCSHEYVHADYLWRNGCYNSEYDTIMYYGMQELGLLCFGFIEVFLQHYAIKNFVKLLSRQKLSTYDNESSNVDIFMKQGPNFISIARNGKTMSLIQVDDVTIKVSGPVVSTVGVIDSMVSMQISNYTPQDQILLSRDISNLLITVKRNEFVRGYITVSSPDSYKAQSIRVATNSRGTVTVHTKEVIYDNI